MGTYLTITHKYSVGNDLQFGFSVRCTKNFRSNFDRNVVWSIPMQANYLTILLGGHWLSPNG